MRRGKASGPGTSDVHGARRGDDLLGRRIDAEATSQKSKLQAHQRRSSLTWHRDGADWVLLAGRRHFGRVVRDGQHPNMWRSTLLGGRLSDMANLAWAKNAVLVAAEREIEWETRAANTPSKCPEKRGVFEGAAPLVAQTAEGVHPAAGRTGEAIREVGR
jgi:hypothetical protein